MILAGLDIATTTGLAVLADGKITTSTFRGPSKRKDILASPDDPKIDPAHEGKIGVAFEDFLHDWLIVNKVQRVAIEESLKPNAAFGTKTEVDLSANWAGKALRKVEKGGATFGTFYRLYGLSFIAVSLCVRLNIPVEMVNQQHWRKEFLGNGRPKNAKDEAVKMCRALGIPITSVDAAEAAGIVWYLDKKLNPYGTARRRAEDLFAKATSN